MSLNQKKYGIHLKNQSTQVRPLDSPKRTPKNWAEAEATDPATMPTAAPRVRISVVEKDKPINPFFNRKMGEAFWRAVTIIYTIYN